MKKQNSKILVVVILVLVIILIMKLSQSEKNKAEILEYIYDENTVKQSDSYPNNLYQIKDKYYGKLTIDIVGKSMYYVSTEVFPEYYQKLKNASEKNIRKFFEKNKSDILMDVGIDNSDSFFNLISYMQENFNVRKLNFDKFRIDNTYAVAGDSEDDWIGTYTQLYITYEDCEEISFYISISNDKKMNQSPLIYMLN